MEFEKKVVELDVNDVLPNRFQPRIKFNEDSINELSESIKEHGVIQPIVVRSMGDKYEIIAGERRYKASLLAGKRTIPAVITNLNDKDSAEVALIENVQRKDLTPIEEAISYKKILDMGYLTQEELAVKLGKTQSTVANKLRLLNLDEEVQEAVLEEKISERHARSLLKLSDVNEQRKMLNKIIENRLTVRKTDEEIAKVLNGINDEEESAPQNILLPEIENPFKVEKIPSEKIPVVEPVNIVNNLYDVEEPIIIIEEPDQLPAVAEDQIAVDPLTAAENPVIENFNLDEIGIPSSPISEAENSISIEKEPEINTNPEMNPGFMNIEAIENNAKDINVEEKGNVDLNSLLKPSIIGEEIKIQEETPKIKEEEPIRAGKFFSLPVEEESKLEESSSTTDTGMSDAFDFEKNMIGGTEMNMPETSVDNITALEPVSLENMSLDATSANESVDALIGVEPIVESLAANADVSSLESEVANLSEEKVVSTENLNTESLEMLESPIDSSTPIVQSEVSEQALSDLADATNNLINPDFDITVNMPVEHQALSEEQPVSSEDMPIPTLEAPSAPINTNIAAALEDVREVINNLEQDNFSIDVEEFDFETEYQIIIKIKK